MATYKWGHKSEEQLKLLFNISGFFGGYLNNNTTTCVIARSHGSKFKGVEQALGIETAIGFANIYSLLARVGKTENISLILSNDSGETNNLIPSDKDTNYIILGGTTQAFSLLQEIAERKISYSNDKDPVFKFDNKTIFLRKNKISFFIYKTKTRMGNNLIFLYSPWALGSQIAAKTISDWYLEFVKAEKNNEFLYVFEFTKQDEQPVLSYKHDFKK